MSSISIHSDNDLVGEGNADNTFSLFAFADLITCLDKGTDFTEAEYR